MRHDGPVAIVRLAGGRLQLVRHPVDGRAVAFADADSAFCFAVSLEMAGEQSAGTVQAPDGLPLHMLAPGTVASELLGRREPLEAAA